MADAKENTEASNIIMPNPNTTGEKTEGESSAAESTAKSEPEATGDAKGKASMPKPKTRRKPAKRKAKQKKEAVFRPSASVSSGAPRRKSSRARRSASSANYGAWGTDTQSAPSASFYLGMVEDGETVEMIERKFARLAELEAAKKAKQESEGVTPQEGESEGLSLEEQEQLFKETSTFTVSNVQREAMDDGAGLLDQDDYGWQMPSFDIDDEDDLEQVRSYMDLDDDFWSDMYEERKSSRRRKKQGGGRRARAPREPRAPKQETKSYVCDRRGHFVTALKRVSKRGADYIAYHRIPAKPLPLSWGRIIEPYRRPVDVTKHKKSQFYQKVPDMLKLSFPKIAKSSGGDFQVRVHACVCVCERERERERESVCVCVRGWIGILWKTH